MNIVNEANAVEVAKTVKSGCVVGPSTVRRSPSLGAYAVALAKAQGEMKNPPKDSVNPHFKSRYADLATVRDCVIPILSKHGLAVMQLPCECEGRPALTTILIHSSGEWVETTIQLRCKEDPQGIGSGLTYARRYALQAIAGIAADDDDDGNAAGRAGNHTQQHQRPQPTVADRCIDAISKVTSRDALTGIYRQYEADREDGVFTDAEKNALDLAFKAAGKKFPPPAAK